MEITALPTPPSTASPDNFDSRADDFLGALPQFQQELNTYAAALNSLSTNSVSTTSLAISVAEKTLTVETGKSYFTGMSVKIAGTTNGSLWMIGDVLSYSTSTGALVVNVQVVQGSGTFSSWSVSLSFNGIVTPEQAPDLATLEQVNQQAFLLRAIGEPFALWTHLTGVDEPSNSGTAKFIKLTAGEDGSGEYNEGLLTSESVSGTAPDVVATAVIDYVPSPMNGQTVKLLNTSRQFIRPGSSGTEEDDQFASHTHPIGGILDYVGAGNGRVVGSTATLNSGATGGDETRPRNIGATYYMRIA